MVFEIVGRDPWIYLKPFHTDEPYVIVELVFDMGRGDTIGLWEDVPSQCCRYRLDVGEWTLRLRVPSSFLDKSFRIDVGDGAVRRIVAKGIRVYADRDYTNRLFDLNPGMREALSPARLED